MNRFLHHLNGIHQRQNGRCVKLSTHCSGLRLTNELKIKRFSALQQNYVKPHEQYDVQAQYRYAGLIPMKISSLFCL
jgi:hypothetical protein